MLYFLVAFIALTAIKQWNPFFGPQAAFHHSDDSCPSTYAHHSYHNAATCAMYNSFLNIDLTLDHNLMGSIWCLYYIAAGFNTHNTGHTAHNKGHTTHNHAGHMTHNATVCVTKLTQLTFYASSSYRLMPGCMTSYPIVVWHHEVTASYGVTNKSFYPSHQCHLSEKIENHTIVFKQPRSESVTDSIYYVHPHKHYSNSQFDQKPHKHYKHSALPLVFAINCSIYYLLNGTFNQAYDVNYLIN